MLFLPNSCNLNPKLSSLHRICFLFLTEIKILKIINIAIMFSFESFNVEKRVSQTQHGNLLTCYLSPLIIFGFHPGSKSSFIDDVFEQERMCRGSRSDQNFREGLFRSHPSLRFFSRSNQLFVVPILHCLAAVISCSPDLRSAVSRQSAHVSTYLDYIMKKTRTGDLSNGDSIYKIALSDDYNATIESLGLSGSIISNTADKDEVVRFVSSISGMSNSYLSSVVAREYELPSPTNHVDSTACTNVGDVVFIHPGAHTSKPKDVVLYSYAFNSTVLDDRKNLLTGVGYHQYRVEGTKLLFCLDLVKIVLSRGTGASSGTPKPVNTSSGLAPSSGVAKPGPGNTPVTFSSLKVPIKRLRNVDSLSLGDLVLECLNSYFLDKNKGDTDYGTALA